MDGWEPVEERLGDVLTAGPVARLAATLGRGAAGVVLPPLWHWLFFLPVVDRSELGPDGHPGRGGFLPPVRLRRRLFAGGRIQFHAPLRIGDSVERRSAVVSVEEKEGRSGPLVLVTVRYEISGPGGVCIVEEQDLAYTDAQPSPPSASHVDPPATAWSASLQTDPVLLFRFSALTFNAHRIHYDAGYARGVEGYPGPVVHGPLVAMVLAGLAGDHDERPMRSFSFRARAPFYAGEEVALRGEPAGDGADMAAYTMAGVLGMEARAEFVT